MDYTLIPPIQKSHVLFVLLHPQVFKLNKSPNRNKWPQRKAEEIIFLIAFPVVATKFLAETLRGGNAYVSSWLQKVQFV